MEKEVICLSCPNGCHIVVRYEDGKYFYEGAKCERGESYAYQEVTDPKRVVTAVVSTDSEVMPFIPVKTDAPISKKYINSLLREIYRKKVKIPVHSGDVLIRDFQGTGVNVVITRTFPF